MNALTPNDHGATERHTLVTFSIGMQMLAIPASILREVLDPLPITRVPGAGNFAPGVVNVRGSVVPLADLAIPYGLSHDENHDRHRIMVIDLTMGGELSTVVVSADAVHEVVSLKSTEILPVSASMSTWPPEYLIGLYRAANGFVILPDLTQIFTSLTNKF